MVWSTSSTRPSGDVNSGNILGSVRIDGRRHGGSRRCVARPRGNGSARHPLHRGDQLHPAVRRPGQRARRSATTRSRPLDFALLLHQLHDDASLAWHDLCNDPAGTGNSNCNPNPPNVAAASQTLIQQLASTTATDIHNAAHAVVTAVAVGTNSMTS